MRVYRICQAQHAAAAFTGEGAQEFGGRWNHIGTPMVYTAEHLSLAALEQLVRVDSDLAPPNLESIAAEIPEDAPSRRLSPRELPRNWRTLPPPEETRALGTEWARSLETLTLIVPSVLIPSEWNVLVNPQHPDAADIRVSAPEPFAFDPRLL